MPADRRRGLAALGEMIRPPTLAHERTLPVAGGLGTLLPAGLPRAATVAVTAAPGASGATSLALALTAGVTDRGGWVAVVGVGDPGLDALAGLGVALERTVLVAAPPPGERARVIATLVDAFAVVVTTGGPSLPGAADRRIRHRLRAREATLVGIGRPLPGPVDVELRIVRSRWDGLGDGHGHLRARWMEVEVGGRRVGGRGRRVEVWLPGPDGSPLPAGGPRVEAATAWGRTG